MNRFILLVAIILLSTPVVAIECDFGNNPDLSEQKCFGATGDQCQGGDPKHPISLDHKTCTAVGYVTIGSIMHDNCCLRNPKGYMCDPNRQIEDLAKGILGGADDQVCGFEWNKAWYDSLNNRGWAAEFGPYYKGGANDNLKPEPARDARVYDSHGQYKRMWHATPRAGTEWHIGETDASRRLQAPKGTHFEFWEDEQFCANGLKRKWPGDSECK